MRWGSLAPREVLGVCLSMATKLFSNLMARCDNIAVAMSARGFRGPRAHALHLGGAPPPGAGAGTAADAERRRRGLAADALVLGSLAALAALAYALP